MGSSPFYRGGYSLLLAPVLSLDDDPVAAYHGVLVVNALLAAALVPLLYLLLTRCFDVGAAGRGVGGGRGRGVSERHGAVAGRAVGEPALPADRRVAARRRPAPARDRHRSAWARRGRRVRGGCCGRRTAGCSSSWSVRRPLAARVARRDRRAGAGASSPRRRRARRARRPGWSREPAQRLAARAQLRRRPRLRRGRPRARRRSATSTGSAPCCEPRRPGLVPARRDARASPCCCSPRDVPPALARLRATRASRPTGCSR